MSYLGKVFTGILNNRLASLSYEFGLLSSAQAGFRNAHSTADNIFILHSLINLCAITPTHQLTGTTPLSKIKLNNLEYIGIIKYTVSFKYSLLMSYLGKVFTGILNNRLASLSDEIGLLSSAQAGFRNAHSTEVYEGKEQFLLC
jgi:hypothetical protein